MHGEMEMVGDSRSKCSNPRFMQPLVHGFFKNFTIPVSFQKDLQLEGHPLERVLLMTEDRPQHQWVVNIKNGRHFKDGWMEFCVDHNLKVGDFLVFTLESHFVFHVSVFDPITACQPQTSYCCISITAYASKYSTLYLPREFTISCGLAKRRCIIKLINEKAIPWQVELSYRTSDDQTFLHQGWKDFQTANNIRRRSVVTFQLIEAGMIPILKCSLLKCSVEKRTTTRVSASDPLSAYQRHLTVFKPLVSKANHKGSDGTTGFESSRKGTEMETEGHIQESRKIPAEQTQYLHCYVTITDCYFNRSIVCLPRHFIRSSGLGRKSCFVKLIDEKGIPWQVRLRFKKDNGQATLSKGWKAFVRANNVKTRSIVCFQLIRAERIPILKCSQVTVLQ